MVLVRSFLQCPSVLISVWSSFTLNSGGLSSRAGSPSGTRTHTKGMLMHSDSQPSGTPLEESAAKNDQGWVWPSQLWLVANSPSVTSSGRGTGKTGVTSDAYLEALVACKDRVSTPEFRWLPQALPQSVAEAHALLLNSVAHHAGRLESDAVVLFGWNLDIPSWAEATCGKLLERPRACTTVTDFGFDGRKDRAGILEKAVLQCFHEWRRTVKVDLVTKDTLPQFRFRCHPPCSISPEKCRTDICAVLQVVLLAVHHLSVVLEVHTEASLWPSRIPMMSSVCRTGDGRPAPVIRCTSVGQTRNEREAMNKKWTRREHITKHEKVMTHKPTTHNTQHNITRNITRRQSRERQRVTAKEDRKRERQGEREEKTRHVKRREDKIFQFLFFQIYYVKNIPPNTEKWLRKRYDKNDDNNMSNETKRETNYSMNNK